MRIQCLLDLPGGSRRCAADRLLLEQGQGRALGSHALRILAELRGFLHQRCACVPRTHGFMREDPVELREVRRQAGHLILGQGLPRVGVGLARGDDRQPRSARRKDDAIERVRAVILFSSGKILRCEAGQLDGMDAMCQLFERPRPATFRFEKATRDAPPPTAQGVLDVMATILEAMRRHDEFNEARAIVPDGVLLMPTGKSPSLPREETDKELAKSVWHEAARGTAPETCEGSVKADAYRVRKLYAHWLEHGALQRRPAA